jgi:hypothetical protein
MMFRPRPPLLVGCLLLFVLLAFFSWTTDATSSIFSSSSTSKNQNAFRDHLAQQKKQPHPQPDHQQHRRQASGGRNTRGPAALFILPATATNFTNLSPSALAIVSNSITDEEVNVTFSSAAIASLAGGVWVQDFNFTYSNALDVVDSHAASALISLLVASGTKHCTSGLCLRDVHEAWARGAIERGYVEALASDIYANYAAV